MGVGHLEIQGLRAVLEELVDVDQDGEDEDGEGDAGGRVPRELVMRPGGDNLHFTWCHRSSETSSSVHFSSFQLYKRGRFSFYTKFF